MAGRKQRPQGDPATRLSRHIDSLQEGFRKLSKAATLKDLASCFVGVLKDIFPAVDIDLFFRPGQTEEWQKIVEGGARGDARSLTMPATKSSSAYSTQEGSGKISVVQKLVDGSAAGVVIAPKYPDKGSAEEDLLSLRLFLHLFENAYQEFVYRRNEKGLIFSLNHRVLQLNSLIDTGIEVAKLDQGASPHHLALERAASLTNASKGVVRVKKGGHRKEEFFFPAGIPIVKSGKGQSNITSKFTFGGASYTFELFEKESRSGIVPFDETDQLLLDALARQVHASLENRFLHEQALAKQKFERDLVVAASIQQKILPKSLPRIAGYEIAGINIPSASVGGDYYNCIPLSDGKYALVIADVAGKGIPAALLVSSLDAYLSAYLENMLPLPALTERLNKVIHRASTDDKFITAFVAILDPGTGKIEFVNAGHNPAYLWKSDGEVQELAAKGLALGMFDMGIPFQMECVTIEPGDTFLLYTDGITEAVNEKREFYDVNSRLREFVIRHGREPAEKFISSLIDDIKRFCGSAPQADDITALYIQRL